MSETGKGGITKLIELQKELMEKVPHTVRLEVYPSMIGIKDMMVKSLLYLTSLGHKPWRPDPLSPNTQINRLNSLQYSVNRLQEMRHGVINLPDDHEKYDTWTRKLISGLGIIEETLEHLSGVADEDEENQLEEITDILFFYLEQVIMSGFTWEQIEAQYIKKHAINLKRYADAEKGDYSWDKRGEGTGL